METKENLLNRSGRLVGSIVFMFFTIALNAEEKFNMGNDAPAPDGFRPIYTIYIFAGMFVIGIGAYYLLKHFNKDPRKREGAFDPSRSNQRLSTASRKSSTAARNARRRVPPQKKTASASR